MGWNAEKRQMVIWKRKGGAEVLKMRQQSGIPWLSFPMFEETGIVIHGFSTRLGGVSQGDCATMNFALNRGDDPANIRENYRRMASALGFTPERMVLSWQTHTTNIRQVTEADAGKGYCRDRDYRDIDGLMTDVPGLVLVTSYADCVPLLFIDPVRRVVAASHSGWRGTVARMGRHTAEAMGQAYGCRPEDLIVGIGPSICQACYEVSEDVAEAFAEEFGLDLSAERLPGEEGNILKKTPGRPGKYQLDLQQANLKILTESGIRPEHICVTDICTCCNKELLFSHRGSMGHRGNMAAFLGLRG